MTDAPLLAQLTGALLTGLAAGGHCLGMCGGLQAALMPTATPGLWRLQGGRSLAYVLLGALAGSVGAGVGQLGTHAAGATAPGLLQTAALLRVAASAIAALALLSLAARMVFRRDLLGLEKLGTCLWQAVQPLARHAGQWREPWRSYGLGLVWAFIPCGLVLSMAALAATTGTFWHGAALLGAFALGTWPALLGAGTLGRLTGLTSRAGATGSINPPGPSGSADWRRWLLALALVLLAAAQLAFLFTPSAHHHPGVAPAATDGAPAAAPTLPPHHHIAALPGFRDGDGSLTLWMRAVRATA